MLTATDRPIVYHRPDRVASRSETLEKLIGDARQYSFEFTRTNPDKAVDPDISSHLELSLISAAELGATDGQLLDFFEDYVPRWHLEKLEAPRRPLDRGNWQLHLGDRRYEAEYRQFFKAEVARLGWQLAIREYLPVLMRGPAASAFHAAIRLGYGAMREDQWEVAEGLAFWAASVLEFPHAEHGQSFTSRPAEVLERLRSDERFRELNAKHKGIGLWARMDMMGHEPAFSPVIDWLAVHEDSMRLIAHDCLALYVETDDLRALHAVTGSQALRELLPFLSPEGRLQAMRYLWEAVCAVYGLMGFIEPTSDERMEELRRLPCPDWHEIKEAACRSLEEHDLKIVLVMSEEELAYGDPIYRYASARRMRLV